MPADKPGSDLEALEAVLARMEDLLTEAQKLALEADLQSARIVARLQAANDELLRLRQMRNKHSG